MSRIDDLEAMLREWVQFGLAIHDLPAEKMSEGSLVARTNKLLAGEPVEDVDITSVMVPGLRIKLDGKRSVFLGSVDAVDVPDGIVEGISYPNVLELVSAVGRQVRLQISNEALQAIVSLAKGQGEVSETLFSFGDKPQVVWVTQVDMREVGKDGVRVG